MKNGQPNWNHIALNLSAVLVRWMLGAVFLYTGLSKALHPVDFLKLVRQYDLVQSSLLLNSIAAALPWFEIFCGLLLLAGVAVRGTALTLMLMLVPLTALVFHRALAIRIGAGHPVLRREIRLRLRHGRGLHLPQTAGKFSADTVVGLAAGGIWPAIQPALRLDKIKTP